MRVKTSEARGAVLDWLVATAKGFSPVFEHTLYDPIIYLSKMQKQEEDSYAPSRRWSEGGAVVEYEHINIEYRAPFGWWAAWVRGGTEDEYGCTGPTPLVAAMRCFVASRLGDEVDVPDELMEAA